jgi:Tol biopolymer transport system component
VRTVDIRRTRPESRNDKPGQPQRAGRRVRAVGGAYQHLFEGGHNPFLSQLFGYDRTTGATNLISRNTHGDMADAGGYEGPASVTGDGRYVAFAAPSTNLAGGDTNGVSDVFIRDLRRGVTRRVGTSSGGGQANGGSDTPSLSANGCFLLFRSAASNLVPGDTNAAADVFVKNLRTGAVRRVSVGNGR